MKNSTSNPPSLHVGDTVAYSRAFLRNCGIWHQEYADRRGTVMEVRPQRHGIPTILEIRWRDGDVQRVLISNLVLASRLHLEPR